MTYDLKIQGGVIVDGTGAEPRPGEVAIAGGRIVAVGECPGEARRVIEAAGALVTPGFVDLHCHYDGQVSWDSDLAPSSLHGVTTCVMGNCGVGFAPVHAADRQRLVELMEGVEDIPGTALWEGIQWGWESFPEYMASIDAFPHAIDFLVQVPHDALRVFVMRERALAGVAATDEDIGRMRELLREALQAGAAGFSTGRTDNHRAKSGSHTPAAEATTRELVGLAGAFAGLSHGVLQAVSDFDMEVAAGGEQQSGSGDRFDAEFDVLEAMAAAADGHPLSISLLQRDMAGMQWRQIIGRAEAAAARGLKVRLQVAPRAIGVLLGLEATFHPFMGFPSYKRIAHLPLAERVREMSRPDFRERILGEQSEPVAGDGSPIPPLADKLLAKLELLALRIFRLGANPKYEPTLEESLAAEAYRRGVPPLAAVYDAILENEGKELLYFPIYNYGEFSLDVVGEMLRHPLSLVGLSDGGAHVGTVCDASFPTFLLTHWVRDRQKDRLALPRAVQMLTADPADYIGLRDRGRVAVGQKADLNVIDLAGLSLERPGLVQDLPAGGKRLLQRANGYRATLVSGEVILENGQLTGLRPGRLQRPGRSG